MSSNNRRGKMIGRRFQTNQTFDFSRMSAGKGLNHFSIRNIGNHNIVLDDTLEVIPPNGVFIIESNIAIMNDDFKVSFGDKTDALPSNKSAVVRYIVDYDDKP